MPIDEEGNKWACEPCIRGHRSTTCQHWDRFMLRVNKPGRPLGKCPHTAKSCTCSRTQVMMVKIVLDSGCFCRPQNTSEEPPDKSALQPNALSTKPEPGASKQLADGATRSSNTLDDLNSKPDPKEVVSASVESLKQPKNPASSSSPASAAHKGFGSCCSTRKPDVPPNPVTVPQSQAVLAGRSNHRNGTLKRALQHDDFVPPNSPMDLGEDTTVLDHFVNTTADGHHFPAAKRRRSSVESFGVLNRQGGCCSSKNHTHQAIVQTAPKSSKSVQESDTSDKIQRINGYQFPSGLSMFSIPSKTTKSNILYQPVETVSDINTGTSSSLGSGISAIETNGFGDHHFDSVTDQLESQDIKYTGLWNDQDIQNTLLDSDACRCGDGCECLACPVHPFNNTTRNEIQELTAILEEDWANQYAAQALPTPNNELNGGIGSSQDFIFGNTFYFDPGLPLTQAPLDHAAQSTTLTIPEYNTLQFMYQQCEGQAPICQCQDDCACPGCPTHNIPPLPEDYENLGVLQPNLLTSTHSTTTNVHPSFPQAIPNIPNGRPQHYYQYQFPLNGNYSAGSQYADSSTTQDQLLASANTPLTNSK